MQRLTEPVRRGAKTSIPLDGASTAIQNLGPSAVNRSRSMNSAAEAVVEKTYSRLSLSRNRRDPLKHFEISVLRHIRFVVLRKKQLEQLNFINENVI